MATALDTRIPPRVATLIARLGMDAVFYVPGSSTYNPATREVTETGVTQYTEKVTPPQSMDYYANGDTIRWGDRRIYLPASGLAFTPERGMKVTLSSVAYRIEVAEPVRTGDSVAVYRLQLRR
jgi:hypothetical protein